MAIGSVNVSSSGSANIEVLIEFDNYTSENVTEDFKMVLELPIGSKYKFTEHNEEQVASVNSILINSPATGYIKLKSGIIMNPIS